MAAVLAIVVNNALSRKREQVYHKNSVTERVSNDLKAFFYLHTKSKELLN